MDLSQKTDFNAFLEKAWQPMWLANFIYCYLFLDIILFCLSGSGIFNYSLIHILELSFANLIITIIVFGVFSMLILTPLNSLLRSAMISIDYRFLKTAVSIDEYSQTRGFVSTYKLYDDKVVKKFENNPNYLTNIYITESEKYNLKIKQIIKLEELILGIIILSMIEMFVLNKENSNILSNYLQIFFENKGIADSLWCGYILTLIILCIFYYTLCNFMPSNYFLNPVLYNQIKNIKNN